MEINGRPWGSLPLAVESGVDFPADYVRVLVDGPDACEPTHGGYEVGVVARNLQLEVLWIGAVLFGTPAATRAHHPPSRRAGLAAIVRLLSPRIRNDTLSWRDPGATAAELWTVAAKLVSKMRNR